ncbi:6PGD fold domain-containing protein [Corynebacterium mastitidis]
MRVGVLRGEEPAHCAARSIAHGLAEAGHEVRDLGAAGEIAGVQTVLVEAAEEELARVALRMAPHVRPEHIVLHAVPGADLEPLEPLRWAGAVVGSLVPLFPGLWAVEYRDEVAQTVLELLVEELGGEAELVSGPRRRALATALSWMRFADDVGRQAHRELGVALEGSAHATLFSLEGEHRDPLAAVPALARQRAGMRDPGKARIFTQLARWAAERDERHDVELWAMQEEKP